MGFYIDQLVDGTPLHPNTKLEKLIKQGAEMRHTPPLHHVSNGKVAVCVIENGIFDAAGICFSQKELGEFKAATTGREHTWLLIDIAHVKAMNDSVEIEDG